jgi:hypothetical protein
MDDMRRVKVYNLDMNAEEAPAFVVAAEDYDALRAERDALRELSGIARQVCDSKEGTQQRTDYIASMRAFLTLRIDAALAERKP